MAMVLVGVGRRGAGDGWVGGGVCGDGGCGVTNGRQLHSFST